MGRDFRLEEMKLIITRTADMADTLVPPPILRLETNSEELDEDSASVDPDEVEWEVSPSEVSFGCDAICPMTKIGRAHV